MPLITSKTLLTSISLFHMTLAFFFLTSPSTVNDQILVYILGESMGIPIVRGFDSPSAPLALLAVVLALLGLSDLVSLSMPEELGSLYHWGTQAPLRSFITMALVFYSYFQSVRVPRGPSSAHDASLHGGNLTNRVVFTFAFLEMITWFWIWVTLREERHGIIERMRKQGPGVRGQ
ncbi:hypothetical protein CDD81_6801 [Ophiocordyceps australis]|uniref:Increased loss of mitochondrial DNA protein 1 n=1 Tax=Ophiocordyceps australis TaxID=1399860 RepID=A0A2C5XZH2_9HYPO|nr:hypothetical protein CDD81_6801 [Ophiocordyceps australis]